MTGLRDLPSVDQMLQTSQSQEWIACFGRPLTVEAIRSTLNDARAQFAERASLPEREALLQSIERYLQSWTEPTLQPVINATGVILQTNLGRAPLSPASLQAIQNISQGYSTLEYDLQRGKRGSRLVHAEALLTRLTGAQAAMVVNNNAAAVLLILTALARRRGVVIARTQLVEIGGGFRVPDVMKQSGARLLEIGTTNRVHLSDYEAALEESPALFLRAHRSNFRLVGFTSEPGLAEIAEVAHQAGIPLVDDLGSGTLLDTSRYGLGHEPMVQESLAAGADLVCFSGDKLLGGPQAGIIVGGAELVAKLKKHPLARALRADKLCLGALTATLLHYLKDEAEREIPIWRMISAPAEQIFSRAAAWAVALGQGEVTSGESTVGGGSLPDETLPTSLLSLSIRKPDQLLARLRQQNPPVIARLQDDRVVLDPRSVLPEQEEALLHGMKRALEATG
ncbi:MAG: L-seryl-tRNA(Sec) selenium transferase [Chloroflexi bacterium RBG_16_57_11]|nr:MAG: L-seryl-tRNA(Sec) selenium transferase [Chloroflexi bacterium RBG_16_57_11]